MTVLSRRTLRGLPVLGGDAVGPLRRIERFGWGMCAGIVLIPVLMEAKPTG